MRYIEAASSGKEEQPKAEQFNAKGPDGMIPSGPAVAVEICAAQGYVSPRAPSPSATISWLTPVPNPAPQFRAAGGGGTEISPPTQTRYLPVGSGQTHSKIGGAGDAEFHGAWPQSSVKSYASWLNQTRPAQNRPPFSCSKLECVCPASGLLKMVRPRIRVCLSDVLFGGLTMSTQAEGQFQFQGHEVTYVVLTVAGSDNCSFFIA